MTDQGDGPRWELSEDLKTVTVSFPTSPPTALKLDAAAVENMLVGVGELRAHMLPVPSAGHALGQAVKAVTDPRWASEFDLMLGGSLLHLRDPRFGWLHFLLPKPEARKLGTVLIAQADAPPPLQPSSPEKVN
jgi:hypothetical protein